MLCRILALGVTACVFFSGKNNKEKLLEYRHVHVMFGKNCSPFLLGAVLEYNLNNVEISDKAVAERLLQTLYVDNFSSEDTVEEYNCFRE